MKVGQIVLFDGDKILFKVLSTILGWFEPEYRKLNPKPWHVGVISRKDPKLGWMVLEATGKGVQENPINDYSPKFYKVYDWFDKALPKAKVKEFVDRHYGKPYDAQAYVWVTGAVLIQKITRVNIGRWKNESFMCWELVEEFCEEMGKPICKENRTITIVDIIKELNYVLKSIYEDDYCSGESIPRVERL